ncbi:hypothetical protein A5784_18210 [Mycobacterium sp. 852013-50091_SCH5140682]|uniref:class I SAM-dependent methyltransferase n=1 Tax=Mycobacterium sp. 852013-50091_SCH5140682 TaxID=1834109 RepID=UPI0007EAD0F1|nr:class I SAM-dependent methyltransferase [Mycobacterium sp. 852013-50091_SCH5140682]OBC01692.1 hypothetical protein A5784_18210 [Mycobacterium sp. 852013-50091_SCH5140682]
MTADWASRLLAEWDEQQTGFLPYREERFQAILGCLGMVVGEHFTALDAGCGPGSLSQRILQRFPNARVIALDADPVHLAIGRAALVDHGDRVEWVDADLRDPTWLQRISTHEVDAVVSTTALHWLAPKELDCLYGQFGKLIRAGGLLLNGDNMAYGPAQPLSRSLADRQWHTDLTEAFVQRGVTTYEAWWKMALECRELYSEKRERERRLTRTRPRGESSVPLSGHLSALSGAGFSEVSTIWQRLDDRVLMGVRSAA